MKRLLLLIGFLILPMFGFAQNSLIRQFFTTNPAPVVQVTAGSNAFVTFTQAGQTRTFLVDVAGGGAGISAVDGTNIAITVSKNATNDLWAATLILSNNVWLITTQWVVLQGYGTTSQIANATNNTWVYWSNYVNGSTNTLGQIIANSTNNTWVYWSNYVNGSTNTLGQIIANSTNNTWVYWSNYVNGSTNTLGQIIANATNNTWVYWSNYVNGSTGIVWNAGQIPALSYLPLSGGTVSGAVLTTSTSTSAPAATEFVIRDYVTNVAAQAAANALAGVGRLVHITGVTNSTTRLTNSVPETPAWRTNLWQGWTDTTATITTNSYTSLTVNDYIRHVVSTNTFNAVAAGVFSVHGYMFRTGGSGTVAGHYEIYMLDVVSNLMYELGSTESRVISSVGVPTLTSFSGSIATPYTATNAGTLMVVAFKMDQVGIAGPTLYFVNGTALYDAHVSFQQPISAATFAGEQITSGTVAAARLPSSVPQMNNTGAITNTFIAPSTFTYVRGSNSLTHTNGGFGLDMNIPYGRLSVTGTFNITGCSNSTVSSLVKSTVLFMTNSTATDYTIYLTNLGSLNTADGARSYVVSNKLGSVLSVNTYYGQVTNAVFRTLW